MSLGYKLCSQHNLYCHILERKCKRLWNQPASPIFFLTSLGACMLLNKWNFLPFFFTVLSNISGMCQRAFLLSVACADVQIFLEPYGPTFMQSLRKHFNGNFVINIALAMFLDKLSAFQCKGETSEVGAVISFILQAVTQGWATCFWSTQLLHTK